MLSKLYDSSSRKVITKQTCISSKTAIYLIIAGRQRKNQMVVFVLTFFSPDCTNTLTLKCRLTQSPTYIQHLFMTNMATRYNLLNVNIWFLQPPYTSWRVLEWHLNGQIWVLPSVNNIFSNYERQLGICYSWK